MPVTTQWADLDTQRQPTQIYATRYGKIDKQRLREELAARAKSGSITVRDERLLEYLRELHVLSLDQIHRLLWRKAKPVTAYNRLSQLMRYQLVSSARLPDREMAEWSLVGRNAYALGIGGWMWLREEVNPDIIGRSLRREQVLHDLLVAEIFVRLIEAAPPRGPQWRVIWAGEEAASFYHESSHPARDNGKKEVQAVIAPDGLAIIQQRQEETVASLPMFIELDKGREAHGRPSSDWGRKVGGYNRFYSSDWRMHPQLNDLPEFPVVGVVTHGPQRLLNLAQAIIKHRKEPVAYYLALWEDLLAGDDILSAPAWLMITPEGKVIGRERDSRQPLLPPTSEKETAKKG